MYTARLPNQPYPLPVSEDALVLHARVEGTAGERLQLADFAKAASQLYETVTRQAVMEAEYVSVVSGWSDSVRGLVGPVRAVSRVAYRDSANVSTDLLTTDYELSALYPDTLLFPGSRLLPRVYPGAAEPVRIFYTAGAQTLEQVPPLVVQFIKLMVAHWYENPQAAVVATNVQELPLGAQDILRLEREPVL